MANVQSGVYAITTPTPSKIPLADDNGHIDPAWIPEIKKAQSTAEIALTTAANLRGQTTTAASTSDPALVAVAYRALAMAQEALQISGASVGGGDILGVQVFS
jgi:hypothetical protein